ncbi:helicase-like transcription factor [Raphidocelis subcapitata]|uniref:Helicase-like transcription factor n=1 Tax=Raphidocelis subcapitata TaxID=307507 RepID=A0A2V0PAI6_9CHLO|nr:helicase-like transcription factor [Raphidocelis subcapitata]|eukprot:GBF96868.1 helicase-like transcription factor [Raphidocelis subcapitata]
MAAVAPAPAGPELGSPGAPIPIDDSGSEGQEGEEAELFFLGSFRSKIVGVQYYAGKVGHDELVGFVREPNNPYDRWAVRVENIRGEKVGHLPRVLVQYIAPLLDSGDVYIEGLMPGSGNNVYTMPIEVFCYGPSLDIAPALAKRVEQGGCAFSSDVAVGGADSAGTLFQGGTSPGGRKGRGGGAAAAAAATAKVLSPQQMESALDRLFEELVQAAGPAPHAAADPEVITSGLYPHQSQALAWMLERENGGGLPPFWERSKEGGGYVCTLTNTPEPQRPAPVRGGILADDMGLGKTLTVLSLIATNRPGAPHPQFTAEPPGGPAAAGGGGDGGGDAAGASGSGGGAGAGGSGGGAGAGASGSGAGASGSGAAAAAAPAGRPKRQAAPRAKRAKRNAIDEREWDAESSSDSDCSGGSDDEEDWGAARGAAKKRGNAKAATKAKAKAKGKAKAKAKAAPAPPRAPAAAAPTPARPAAAAAAAGGAGAAAAAAADPDAPAPAPPAAGGPRATLLVAPLSVLSNWTTQLEEHTAGSLSCYVYHGADRNRSPTFLAGHDLVVTTYSVLGGELANPRSGLMAVNWLRVVLDEGHSIKNPATRQAQAAMKLKTERRWVVTGTPLQNHVSDLYAMMAFLRVAPLGDRAYFRRLLERPLKASDERALMRLQILMGALALRRTKVTPGTGGQPLVALPPKTTLLVQVDLGPEDGRAYSALEAESRALVGRTLNNADALTAQYTHVLAILMRLRQVCNSRTLCPDALELLRTAARAAAGAAAGAPPPPELLAKLLAALTAGGDSGGSEECSVCLNPFDSPCITRCGHVFCRPCILSVIARDKPACPLCRAPVSEAGLVEPPPPEPEAPAADAGGGEGGGEGGGGSQDPVEAACKGSSKALVLLERLRAMPPGHKAVVFSQFLGMLDIVCAALTAAGLPFLRLDGSCPAAQRAQMLAAFAAPDGPRVFVASLKAGGVGMNLTAGCQVHLLEPHYNPAVEDQAADRVHRLGQTRPVTVCRYIARGTIEERMLQLQDRKRALAQAAFDVPRGGREAAREARARDIRLLMAL